MPPRSQKESRLTWCRMVKIALAVKDGIPLAMLTLKSRETKFTNCKRTQLDRRYGTTEPGVQMVNGDCKMKSWLILQGKRETTELHQALAMIWPAIKGWQGLCGSLQTTTAAKFVQVDDQVWYKETPRPADASWDPKRSPVLPGNVKYKCVGSLVLHGW